MRLVKPVQLLSLSPFVVQISGDGDAGCFHRQKRREYTVIAFLCERERSDVRSDVRRKAKGVGRIMAVSGQSFVHLPSSDLQSTSPVRFCDKPSASLDRWPPSLLYHVSITVLEGCCRNDGSFVIGENINHFPRSRPIPAHGRHDPCLMIESLREFLVDLLRKCVSVCANANPCFNERLFLH